MRWLLVLTLVVLCSATATAMGRVGIADERRRETATVLQRGIRQQPPGNRPPAVAWQDRAALLYGYLFNDSSVARGSVSFTNISVTSAWYSGHLNSLPSYLGRTSICAAAPGEALAVVGVVLGAAAAGCWSQLNTSVDPRSVLGYVDINGVVWNNPPGPSAPVVVPTFWYSMLNQYMLLSALELLNFTAEARAVTLAAHAAWQRAADALGHNWNHTGFNWQSMQAIDNGLWREGDVAGGVAWLALSAAQLHEAAGNSTAAAEALAAARRALDFLEVQTVSPLYETLLPLAVLAAAKVNALQAGAGSPASASLSPYNVSRLLDWSLSDGHNQYRAGWGALPSGTRFGNNLVEGLIGSLTDGGGYAFFGNTAWFLGMLASVPVYAPALARRLAVWIYQVLDALPFFFGDAPEVAQRQSNPKGYWDPWTVVAYEGLRKCDFNRTRNRCLHGEDFGPFATGDWCELLDCDDVEWVCNPGAADAVPCRAGSDRALYGGAVLGVVAALAKPTNVSGVWQLDLQAAEAFRLPGTGNTYLYYNPSADTVSVALTSAQCCGPHRQTVDLWDVVAQRVRWRMVPCACPTSPCAGLPPFGIPLPPDHIALLQLRWQPNN